MAHDPSGSGRSDPYTDGDDRKEHHEAAFDLRGHADLLRGGSELGGFALQTSARMLAEEGGVAPGATRGGDETFDVADAMPLMRSVPSAPVATLPAMSMMRAAPVYRDAGAAVHPGHGMLSHMGDHLGDHLDSSMLRGSAPSFGKGMPDLAAMMPSSDAATKLHERLLDDESVISPPFLPPPPYPLERHTYAVPCERGMAAVHVVRGLKRALGECKIDAEFVEGECRWECNVVSSGQRSTFHLRLHSVEAGFCLEFQRRKGCSIVFNVAVRGVLDHLSNTHFGGKQLPLFKRSEKDKQVPRTAGFYIASFDIPDVPLDLGVPLDFTSGGLLGSDHEAGAKDEALLLELADADKHEDVDSVMALVDMANAPEGGHVAVEGTTGLAILSHGEGREALLEPGHVEEVVRAAAKGLASKDLCQRCAAATLVADLTEDERGHDAVVSTGCLDKVLETARAPHNPSNAHVRRECLRALLQLAQGKHRGAVASKGGAECVKKVAACCSDARMADTARLAVQYLQ